MSGWVAPEDGWYATDPEAPGGFRKLTEAEVMAARMLPTLFRTGEHDGVPVREVLAPVVTALPNGQVIPAGTWTAITLEARHW